MGTDDELNAGTHRCFHWTSCSEDADTLLTRKGAFREDWYCEEHAEELLARHNVVEGRWWSQ